LIVNLIVKQYFFDNKFKKGANVSEMWVLQYLSKLTGEICDEYDYFRRIDF
jgi:hypothetical protein